MAKGTALELVRDTLKATYVVDVRRGPNGSFTVATAIDSPAELRPGRYHMLDGDEMQSIVARLAAVEASLLLATARRNAPKRTSPKRRG